MIRAPHLGVELLRLARTPRPHTIRILFVGAMLGLAAFSWSWWNAELNKLLQGSWQMFQMFFFAEMALAIFVAPALVAPAIPAEREAGTLELLVMCPEPEGHLVLGKLVAQAVYVGGVLAAGFPFAFACTLLGGVPLGRAACACIHIAMTATFASCLALRCSLAWRGATAASLAAVFIHAAIVFCSIALAWIAAIVVEERAYVGIGIIVGIFAAAIWVRWFFIEEAPTGCFGLIAALLFFIGVGLAFADDPLPGRRPATRLAFHALCPWLAYAHDAVGPRPLPWTEIAIPWVLQGTACILLLRGSAAAADSGRLLFGRTLDSWGPVLYDAQFRSVWRERQREALEARRAAGEKVAVSPVLPPKRFALHPRGDLVNMAKDNPFLPVGRNPIYWKETSWTRFPSLNKLRAVAIGTAWICAVTGGIQIAGDGDTAWLLSVELALLVAMMIAATGTAIAEERESGTLAVLLSTGYPSRRIVFGKALAAMRWCFPLMIPMALHLGLATVFLGNAAAGAAFVFAATALSVLGTGIAVSAISRRPRFAFGGTAFFLIALWTAPSLLSLRFPEVGACVLLNPFTALEQILTLSAYRSSADPIRIAVFAGASLALAVVLPMLAALRLERQVRA